MAGQCGRITEGGDWGARPGKQTRYKMDDQADFRLMVSANIRAGNKAKDSSHLTVLGLPRAVFTSQ